MSYGYSCVEIVAKSVNNDEVINLSISFNESFDNVIKILQKAFNNPDITYFKYIDDDEDSIVVSCDDDLVSVFLYYADIIKQTSCTGGLLKPLNVIVQSENSKFDEYKMPSLTISLDKKSLSQKNRESIYSNNSSSKSANDGSNGGKFIGTRDELMSVNLSDNSPVSSMSEEPYDQQWSANSNLSEDQIYLIGEIGAGITGRVMRALHTSTQQMIAVKIIDLDLDREESVKQLILAELSVLRLSKSPYIIEFIGAYFVETSIHICTELMDGFSLDRYGVIPEPILSKLVVLVVNGLEYLWSNNIIHRDVKPSNMLINTNGQVKLCDFGLSKQLVRSIAKTFTGTMAYMCPERLRGENYHVPSDVWSLGISICVLSTGQHPFIDLNQPSHTTPANIMNRIIGYSNNKYPISISDNANNDRLSEQCRDFVINCLARLPHNRLNTASIKNHSFYLANIGDHHNLITEWIYQHSMFA